MDTTEKFTVCVADASHIKYTAALLTAYQEAAGDRDAAIALRSSKYLATKMRERKAVIALHGEEVAGFCYIETWENKHYIAHSGLLVLPQFRGQRLATRIQQMTFALSRLRWPDAKIYSLTASPAVMHINNALGYVPIPFAEMTPDEVFWRGCGDRNTPYCHHFDVLARAHRRYCVCTAMVYDPARHTALTADGSLPQDIVDFVQQLQLEDA